MSHHHDVDENLVSKLVTNGNFQEAINYCLDIMNKKSNENKYSQYSDVSSILTLAYLYSIAKKDSSLILALLSQCVTLLDDLSLTIISTDKVEEVVMNIKCCLEIASLYYQLKDYNLADSFYQKALSILDQLLTVINNSTDISSINTPITTTSEYAVVPKLENYIDLPMRNLLSFLEIAAKFGLGCSLFLGKKEWDKNKKVSTTYSTATTVKEMKESTDHPGGIFSHSCHENDASIIDAYSNNINSGIDCFVGRCNEVELLSKAGSYLIDSIQYFESCIFKTHNDYSADYANNNNQFYATNIISTDYSSHINLYRILPYSYSYGDNNGLLGELSLDVHTCILYYLLDAYKYASECIVMLKYWNKCNQLLDRSIECCNVLIVKLLQDNKDKNTSMPCCYDWYQSLFLLPTKDQFHYDNETTTTTTATTTSAMNAKIKIMVSMLRKHRARSYIAKALLYKNQGSILGPTGFSNISSRKIFYDLASHSNPKRFLDDEPYVCKQYFHLYYQMEFDSMIDGVTIFLSFAADELRALEIQQVVDRYYYCQEVLEIYKLSANLCMENTVPIQIEPFQFDRYKEIVNIEVVEKAYNAWRNAYSISNHKLTLLKSHINSSIRNNNKSKLYLEKYYYLQQAMLALYYAGICAFAMNDLLAAQRAFESAETIRFDIDQILKILIPSNSTTATNNSSSLTSDALDHHNIHEYYILSGDLSYHLSYVYYKQSKYTSVIEACHVTKQLYSLAAATSVCNKNLPDAAVTSLSQSSTVHFHTRDVSSQIRFRLRQNLILLAMVASTIDDGNRLKNTLSELDFLYIGPLENKDMELHALQKHINEQQQERVKQKRNCNISNRKIDRIEDQSSNIDTTISVVHDVPTNMLISQSQPQFVHETKSSSLLNHLSSSNSSIINHNLRVSSSLDKSNLSPNENNTTDTNANVVPNSIPHNINEEDAIDWNLVIAYSILVFTFSFLLIIFYPRLSKFII